MPEWNVRSHFLRKLISNNNHRIAPLVLALSSRYYEHVIDKAALKSSNYHFRNPANPWVPALGLNLLRFLINIPGTKIPGYKNHVTLISEPRFKVKPIWEQLLDP